MKKIFTIALLFCTAMAFAESTKMPRFDIPTARSNSMGGHHVAYTDNVFSLLVNPAAIMRVEQMSFFALSPSVLNPQTTFSLLGPLKDIVSDNDFKSLGNEARKISDKRGSVALGFDLSEFPLSIAWVANGFGVGAWNRIFINPNIDANSIEIVFDIYADMIMPVGFAFKILRTGTHDVDAGITVKPFMRVLIDQGIKITKFIDDDFKMKDELSTPIIMGAGLDLGFLYRWDVGFSAGLTFNDIVTRGGVIADPMGGASGAYYVPFSMNWGVAYDFKVGQFWQTDIDFLSDLGIAAAFDWRDFTNVFQQKNYMKRNAVLGIGVGLQMTMMDMFKLRVGMNECLPAFGFGVDFGSLEFDFAYYGKELGLEPGSLPAAVVEFTFAIRPKAKKRSWPWTKRSAVGLITGVEMVEEIPEEEDPAEVYPEVYSYEVQAEEIFPDEVYDDEVDLFEGFSFEGWDYEE